MKFQCYCENVIEIDTSRRILLDSATMESISNGDFMVISCDKCGKILKPELELDFSTEEGQHYHLVPENDRITFFEQPPKSSQGLRYIVGYRELVELVLELKHGFSPQVIELIKLQIVQKVEEPADVVILLEDSDEDSLTFHIHGLKENEVGVISIPKGIYERISKDLPDLSKQEPYKSIISGPYISLRNHIELEIDG